MSCSEQLRTQAWLDGECDKRESRKAEAHVESCAECRDFAASVAAIGGRVRSEAERYRAPEHLVARIARALDTDSARLPRPRAGRLGFWLGGMGGVAASALAAALTIFALAPPSPESLVNSIGQAHIRALMTNRTVFVASSNHHMVKPWFAGRVPLSPPVADFAAQGFALLGGRTDTAAGSSAAVLAYRHGRHEIDLFVWADRASKLPVAGISHGYHMQFWKNGDLDFAAVSDTEPSELSKFVRLVKTEPE